MGTSGSALTTTMTAFTATSTSTGVSAAGTESDPAGNALYAFAAIPVVSQQALANNILSNGIKPLLKFKIDAMGGTVAWNEITFDVVKDAATTVGTNATTGITLWDVTNGGNTSVAGVFTNAATVYGAGNGAIKFVPTSEQQISSSKVYELRGIIAAADASGDFVSVTIANDSAAFVALDTYANILTADSDAPIIWSDVSASSHATTTADWTSDFGVKNLPVTDTLNF